MEDQMGEHSQDDTAMRAHPAHPNQQSAASRSSSAPKFLYNLLHYPHYPSYDVLLEKRFKTVPLPIEEIDAPSYLALYERTRGGSDDNEEPMRRKRLQEMREKEAEIDVMDDDTERHTHDVSRPAKRRRTVGCQDDAREGACSSTPAADIVAAATLLSNGIEPEDLPAEDDCEAEPSQTVEDEHSVGERCSSNSLPLGESASVLHESPSVHSSLPCSPSTTAPRSPSTPFLYSTSALSSSTVSSIRKEGLSRDDMKANALSIGHLLLPLAQLQNNLVEVGHSLRNHRFHYNLDLWKLVEGIDRNVTELNHQILSRQCFLSFVLNMDRPVQTNLGYFGVLPIELVLHVFSFLDGKDLLLNASVCPTFAVLSNDPHLWKGIIERGWETEGTHMQKPSHKSYRWLFECKKRLFKAGDLKNGKGSCVGEHGDTYEGEWKANKRHGIGTALMQDGRRYDGEWENDMRSGFGIFRWPVNYAKNGGDLYAGNWKEDQRHGEGIYIWADGTKYEGQWKEGKREGFGSVVWPDGRRYEGDYKDGKMSGKGTFCWPDGSIYVGEYKDGKRHGEGTYTYSTMMGGVYTGQWRNGMRDGWGKLIKNDGEMYQGVWKFNCPFGGVLTKKDGTVIEKFWRLFPQGPPGGPDAT